jgi:ElaB/YqjD/DUF883 family membrane-anchored ribosome-binding protein
MENVNQIIERLNECGITVYNYKENNKLLGYELNTYTDAGVNQILFIDFRDSELNPKNAKHFIELFNERVNEVDIDDEIKNLINDERYMEEIGLTVGLQDLKDWKRNLQNIFTKTNKKAAQQIQYEQVKDKLQSLLERFQDELKLMPTKGNTKDDCQKINLLHYMNELDSCVNGIELEDFTPNEYSGNFKLSYS